MAERSGVAMRFDASALPLYPGALAAADAGVRTGGDARNRAHLEAHVRSSAPAGLEAIAYDPQTSGGLLAAIDPGDVAVLAGAGFVVVGSVADDPAGVELGS
jgi:selenide,water dikinase